MDLAQYKKHLRFLLVLPVALPLFIMFVAYLINLKDSPFAYIFVLFFGSLFLGSVPYGLFYVFLHYKMKKIESIEQFKRMINKIPLYFLPFMILPFAYLIISSKAEVTLKIIGESFLLLLGFGFITLLFGYFYVIIFHTYFKIKERKKHDKSN